MPVVNLNDQQHLVQAVKGSWECCNIVSTSYNKMLEKRLS